MKAWKRRDVHMFGIRMAAVTEAEAVERIIALAKKAKAEGEHTHCVATVNVDFLTNAVRMWPFQGYPELWNYLKNVDFAVADGMPLVWLSRFMRQGRGLPERVTGSDTMPLICKRCADEGLGVYVLGSELPVLMEAFARLRETSPTLRIAGLNSAQVTLDDDQGALVDEINRSGADVLFLAMSHPKQELWISRNAPRLRVGLAIGVGGAFNFFVGVVPRAPEWVQRSGLEWVYRICMEPRRLWKRYAWGGMKFLWIVAGEMLSVIGRAW